MSIPEHSDDNVTPMTTKPGASVVTVDPATAQRWLDRNTTNRNLRESRITQYTRDMLAGNWHLTGEPIKFAADGRLLDGQHRLAALIRAGVTLQMFVARGLSSDTQLFMDTGAARMAGDALGLQGENNANKLAATARLACTLETNPNTGTRHAVVSHAQVYEWVTQNPSVRDAVRRTNWNDLRTIKLSPSVLSYCYFRCAQVDPFAADRFFIGLGTHVNQPPGSPILALSARLEAIRRDRMKPDNRDLVLIVFRAWNAWRADQSSKQIKLPRSDDKMPIPQ